MLPALGCLYGGLSMACTTGNFWTKAKLSRPSTTLPNCKRSGPSLISPRSNAIECTESTITPRPHVAKTTKSLLVTFSWTVLAHPSYSPDLAPTNYHLFLDMQRSLEGTDFKTKRDVENWLVSYFASKKPEFLRTGTMRLQNRWQTVVDKEGKYY
uniref:Histone-lysine N-methyltransferase SETMAR n=1 Tax=Caenorhabditis japonica TaxID=281687 RepID=A0A8R1DJN4_CAEJA